MLRQVLVNLCDNSALAVKDRGTGRGKVVFTLSRTDTGTALDVADDGPGISSEVRPRLFEPYTTSRRIGEGMGLGLAISRKILLDHGGDLELLATSPAGTTFRLLFPHEAAASIPAGEGEEP
jgi:C4-dicarboxylate-specific signal transduction histidine kinase